jgi:long-chain acyl-CoA synthetase
MTVTYADKPWLKRYDQGVPHTLQYPSHTVHQMLSDAALNTPDATAIVSTAHVPVAGRLTATLNYRDLNAQADALAAALVDMGVKKGDRVAMILPNCAQFVIGFFGILKAGGIVVACNPTYPGPKLAEQIKDSGATVAIVLSKFYNTLKEVQAQTDLKTVIVTNIKEYLPPVAAFLFTVAKERKEGHRIEKHPVDHALPDLLAKYKGKKVNVTVMPTDIAIYQYTGGTTGTPKGAMAQHKALVTNTHQGRAWLVKWEPAKEVYLGAIPLFHVFGMIAVMCFAVSMSASIVMVPNPREIHEVLEAIQKYKCTIFMGVPAMYNAVNNHPDVQAGKYDLRSVRACISGSAPLPPITKAKFEELTGGKLVEGYGLSETAVAVCVNPIYSPAPVGSIGLPLPDVEMKIVSLDDGLTEVPVGKEGEVVIHAPTLMVGYHNNPTETENVLRHMPDGKVWFYSGDIGKMDEDGYFYIVDRKKDMVLIGGFNVYPANVEKVLMEHPAVRDAGVAGIPHPEKPGQEALKAWVVKAEDRDVTEKEIIEFAQSRLARYEVPTRVEFVSELPKTTVLKVLRRELQRMEKEKTGQKDIPASVKQ